MTFLDALETGYGKYKNPYHNQIHAADVTQTVHCFLLRTGMVVGAQEIIPPWFRVFRLQNWEVQTVLPFPFLSLWFLAFGISKSLQSQIGLHSILENSWVDHNFMGNAGDVCWDAVGVLHGGVREGIPPFWELRNLPS